MMSHITGVVFRILDMMAKKGVPLLMLVFVVVYVAVAYAATREIQGVNA